MLFDYWQYLDSMVSFGKGWFHQQMIVLPTEIEPVMELALFVVTAAWIKSICEAEEW